MNVNATLQKALSQLEAERRQIDKQIAAIRDVLGSSQRGKRKKAAARGARRSGRRMTAVQKKAVSQRMKKYWAGRRKAKSATS